MQQQGVGVADPFRPVDLLALIPSRRPLRPHHNRTARGIEAAEIDWHCRRPVDLDALDIGGVQIAVRTPAIQVDGSPVVVIHPQRRRAGASAGPLCAFDSDRV